MVPTAAVKSHLIKLFVERHQPSPCGKTPTRTHLIDLGQCQTRNGVERESCSTLLRVWHWP